MSETLHTDDQITDQTEPIKRSIEVNRDVETAFRFFLDRFSDWWPADRHSVSAMNDGPGAQRVVLEGEAGGRLYEVTRSGDEIEWGAVESLEPGRRLVINWHPGSGPDRATQVEFRFVPTGEDSCRIDLEHRGWERLGEDATGARDSYAKGWIHVFDTCLNENLRNIA